MESGAMGAANGRTRERALGVALLASSVLPSACLAPPAVLEAEALHPSFVAGLYPAGSELLELPKPGGGTLRALHVPAGEAAPLVLHLLDSAGSIVGAGSDFGVVAWQLRELGLASLFFDYTGVGLSEGRRSVENLRADAEVAWREALRLTGRDPSRVVLRGISLGTLAAAELLAAAALANDDWVDSWRMLWLARIHPFPTLDFEDRVAALSLRDSPANLPIRMIEVFTAGHDLAWRYEGEHAALAPSVIGGIAANHGNHPSGEPYAIRYQLKCGLDYDMTFDLEQRWNGEVGGGLTPAEASRSLARFLLKAHRIPDRVRSLPDGSVALEAYWEGRWQTVDYAPVP